MTATPPAEPGFTATLRMSQIIAAALTLGVIAFGAVAVLIRGDEPARGFVVSAIAVAAAVSAVIARQIFVAAFSGRATGDENAAATADAAAELARRRGVLDKDLPVVRDAAEARLNVAASDLAQFQTRLIVGHAILEGAALFNIVAYMVEGRWWSFLAVGGLLVLMLLAYPTAGKLRRWVDDRAQLREFGPNNTP